MELVFLLLTILGIIVAITFGYLQVVVPFIKGEVRFSKRFPFVETAEVAVTKPRRRKKRMRKRFLIPGLAIGILIILFALIRFLVFQAKAIERVPIAVINFTNHTGDEQFDYLCAAIPNLLITNLEQSKHLSVLTWERMRDLLKILGKEDVPTVDEDLGFEICKMDDIDAVITGSFTKAGNMFVTEVKVLDVASKKILKTSSSQGEGVASILKIQIDELSQDIAKSVSLYERVATPTDMHIMEVTTSSMEAYNYFLRGREDAEKFYFDEARKFLEKAIEFDSTFAAAYYALTHVYAWLRDYEAFENALAKAFLFADRAAEKDRLYIEGYYAEDPEKSFRIFEQLAKKYPKEKWAHWYLGNHYTSKELTHKAIEEYNKALVLDPNWGLALNNLAYRYAKIDDYSKAIECLKRYATTSPGDANPFDSMGDLYFRMGQLDDALAQYKEALFVKPDFLLSSPKIAYIYALREDYAEAMKWVDYYIAVAPYPGVRVYGYRSQAFYSCLLGNFDQALNALDTFKDLLEPTEWEDESLYTNRQRGWVYYDMKEFEMSYNYFKASYYPASPYFRSHDSGFVILAYHLSLGLVHVAQGNLDSARVRLATIKSLLPDAMPWNKDLAQLYHDFLYAEVLLAEDSPEKAMAVGEKLSELEIDDATNIYYWFSRSKNVVARAYIKKGDADRAIAEYLRLTDPDPVKRGRCLIRPTWHYELAKLYEEKGLKAKAIQQYEKFLEIWKNADADRPELIDAKERLAKLKAG